MSIETVNPQPITSDVSSPEPTVNLRSSLGEDEEIFVLRHKASSTRNFAVLLVKHFFESHELDGRNVKMLESFHLMSIK